MPNDLLKIIVLGLLVFILQIVSSPLLEIGGIKPDFLLIYVLIMAKRGKNYGLLTGFAAGLLQDIFIISNLGIFALAKCTIGFWVGWYFEEFNPGRSLGVMSLLITLSAFLQYLVFGIIYLQGIQINLGSYFLTMLLPSILYVSFLGILWEIIPKRGRNRL